MMPNQAINEVWLDGKMQPGYGKGEMMDKFEQWFKSQEERELTPHEWVQEAWQEATKQRDAQYELMAEHTALSIREDAIIGERKRIVGIIPTNWCDPLLTGENSIIGEPPYDCKDIERLLLAIKGHVEKEK